MVLSRRAAASQPILHPEDEARLIEAWKKGGDVHARARIVKSYLRVCYKIAARYSSNPDHIEDLVQEGCFGILRALDRFDDTRGARFSTYSRLWIHNFIASAASRVSGVVDVPARTYLDARSGKLTAKDNPAAYSASLPPLTLDLGWEEGSTPSDDLVSDAPSPEATVIEQSDAVYRRRIIANALSRLTERERSVINRRFLSEDTETLEQIATDYGITRERVRQIEAEALKSIRTAFNEIGVSSLTFR